MSLDKYHTLKYELEQAIKQGKEFVALEYEGFSGKVNVKFMELYLKKLTNPKEGVQND